MKNKVIVFIIGVLVGAILATGGFFIYENYKASDKQFSFDSKDGRPELPDGVDFKGGTPPDMKDGDGNTTSRPSRTKGDSSKANTTNTDTNTNANTSSENQNATTTQSNA